MSPNLRSIRFATLAVCASACVALLAGSASSMAATTKNCSNFPEGIAYPVEGQQWSELRTTRVTCAYAWKFLRPYGRCQSANETRPKGECKRKVQGFTCHEGSRRYSSVQGQQVSYGVRVTCRRGTQRIAGAYTQDLGGG